MNRENESRRRLPTISRPLPAFRYRRVRGDERFLLRFLDVFVL
jgi:hypothetical protein